MSNLTNKIHPLYIHYKFKAAFQNTGHFTLAFHRLSEKKMPVFNDTIYTRTYSV